MNSKYELSGESMYLVLPVPFREENGKVFVEAQAANGLDRWADNFSQVTVAAPVLTPKVSFNPPGFVWREFDSLEHRDRISFQDLPWAFSPHTFLKQVGPTRQRMAESIRRSKHLQFAIGGLWGDWASIASLEAIHQKRCFAVHTDRVEHEVIRKTKHTFSLYHRIKATFDVPVMERYHRYIIQRCSLGLWHGDDCYRAYSPWCTQSHLVHDIHTKPSDIIDDVALDQKLEEVKTASPLRICYTGRLDPMKAPLEWLRAIAVARDLGVPIQATWFGEGALLSEARQEASRLKLDAIVRYPGFVSSREELLKHVRSSHIMMFTHVTPESPRNLLESLISGTPILGYNNAYAANLLEGVGGGILSPIHDYEALARNIASVAQNRGRLVDLMIESAKNGRRFSDAAVFAERSDLIKRFA